MNSSYSKAHFLPKWEPIDSPTIQVVEPFAKTETHDNPRREIVEPYGKAKPLDFSKKEKVKPFGKREPLDFPKIERAKPFDKTEPLDFPKTKTVKPFGKEPAGSKFGEKQRKTLLLRLSRIRDFIRLLLNYPVRIVHDSKLKVWTHEASNRKHLLGDVHRLLKEKPLQCFKGLLPIKMLKDVEAGGSSMFADKIVIPEAILNLAANLAVDQLFQTLLSEDDHVRNIHHVLLSTRNGAEKRLVAEKIEAVFKDKENMLCLNKNFLRVLLIDASIYQSQVEVHVRQQIAHQLQLPIIEGDEIEGNDDGLIRSIEKEMSRKKYLVLLVDGYAEEPLDPRKLGFPEEELAGVVVLITTESSKQSNDELKMAMDLKIRTEDHLLPWEVFCQNVGNELVRSSNAIQTIAVHIVEECGSHLLAIAIVARSLKNAKHVKPWEHAPHKLHWLRPSYDSSMFHGQSRVMVNAFINFIWHEISKTQKHCVTRCLFIPEIEEGKLENELINDWISSQLVFAGEAEHNLTKLLDHFVLLQFRDAKSRYIQMPKDIYDILQSINTQNPLFMKNAGLGLIKQPNSELWHSTVHIDLADNKLFELPLSPNCMELKVLLLHNNVDLTKIPPVFFLKMPLLCILDLSYTSVRELPNSFFELEQLRELYMKGCERFMKLPSEVGKLKKLEKLDLDKTQIIHLPKEIQELTNLQSLILCFYEYRGKKSIQYTSSTIIPSGVISKLKRLTHLSIDVNPDDHRWHENIQVILPEIFVLECLQIFSIYIPQSELLKLIPLHIFDIDFRFVVGQHMPRIISGTPTTAEVKFKQSECSLKFVKGIHVPHEIKKVMKYSKALFLDRHMTIKDLTKFGVMNLEQLQVCILAECKEMQTIVDGRYSSNKVIFPHLLLLSVSYMKNLRSICEGQVHSRHSFGMLKSLVLHNCPKLTTIFTLDFLVNLSLLKVLIVKDCPKVSALITCGSSKFIVGTFLPKLRTMLLLHLPELISISNGLHMGPNLENLGIYNCPKLQSLSKMELSSNHLRFIKGETKWWEALKWSEVEWGKGVRPSKFDHIFCSINNQMDIMTQLGEDDDIDHDLDRTVDEPLQPFKERIFKDPKQNADRSSRMTSLGSKEISKGEGTLEDGYDWRMYGQKNILGSKFPRIYFSCVHRQCFAKKHVHRSDEDPAIFEITYKGRHNCTPASSVRGSTLTLNVASNAVLGSSSFMCDSAFTPFYEDPILKDDCDSTVTELTQASSTSKANIMSQLEIDDDDIDGDPDYLNSLALLNTITADGIVGEPLEASSEKVSMDGRQIANRKKTMPIWTTIRREVEDRCSSRKYDPEDILRTKFPRD